jgi:hypothetical protein
MQIPRFARNDSESQFFNKLLSLFRAIDEKLRPNITPSLRRHRFPPIFLASLGCPPAFFALTTRATCVYKPREDSNRRRASACPLLVGVFVLEVFMPYDDERDDIAEEGSDDMTGFDEEQDLGAEREETLDEEEIEEELTEEEPAEIAAEAAPPPPPAPPKPPRKAGKKARPKAAKKAKKAPPKKKKAARAKKGGKARKAGKKKRR